MRNLYLQPTFQVGDFYFRLLCKFKHYLIFFSLENAKQKDEQKQKNKLAALEVAQIYTLLCYCIEFILAWHRS